MAVHSSEVLPANVLSIDNRINNYIEIIHPKRPLVAVAKLMSLTSSFIQFRYDVAHQRRSK